jgi:hypothetical protein
VAARPTNPLELAAQPAMREQQATRLEAKVEVAARAALEEALAVRAPSTAA